MYKINAFDVDENEKLVPLDMPDIHFPYHKDAQMSVMRNMMEIIQSLVQISHENQLYCNAFTPHLDYFIAGRKIDGVIRCWNIPSDVKGDVVALLQIVWVNESDVDEWNKKLKDTYGDELTLWIQSTREDEEEDEEDIEYFFTGATIQESDYYDSPEDAYFAACDYLNNLGC